MPKTPEQFEQIRNEKKKIIQNVALELFANQGYAYTSISQIAQKAGISKGLMYNYFESKEDLLNTILGNFVEEMTHYIDPNMDNEFSEDEALDFIDMCFNLFTERCEEMKLFYQLGTQTQVTSFFVTENMLSQSFLKKELIIDFFRKKGFAQPEMEVLNLVSTIKGFGLQYVLAPDIFPKEILIQYREYLKDKFIRNNQ